MTYEYQRCENHWDDLFAQLRLNQRDPFEYRRLYELRLTRNGRSALTPPLTWIAYGFHQFREYTPTLDDILEVVILETLANNLLKDFEAECPEETFRPQPDDLQGRYERRDPQALFLQRPDLNDKIVAAYLKYAVALAEWANAAFKCKLVKHAVVKKYEARLQQHIADGLELQTAIRAANTIKKACRLAIQNGYRLSMVAARASGQTRPLPVKRSAGWLACRYGLVL
jgi:hypothetical protein